MLRFIKDFFQFSNTEQKGFISLIVMITLLVVVPRLWVHYHPPKSEVSVSFLEWAEKQESETNLADNTNVKTPAVSVKEPIVYELFPFDPNTVSLEALVKLGIPSKTAQTLINFRNKGGQFYQKEDLLKVYGLSQSDYQRIAPFIHFPKKDDTFEKHQPPTPEEVTLPILDINLADSAAWTILRGIGPTYASRIVKYRNLLGGFHTITQLKEVYGITDSLVVSFQSQLALSSISLNTLDVNEANFYQLNNHPYISKSLANGIINYRTEHGPFTTIDELKKLYILDEETFVKIRPYLSVE